MAMTMSRVMMKLPASSPKLFQASARRQFTSDARSLSLHNRPYLKTTKTQQNFRRAYADAAAPVKRSRSRQIFKWLWRAIYLSALGGVGYVGWEIWDENNPNDQYKPDPKKKTIVVLGTGWASVSYLKTINAEDYNIIVISPRNYFLFTPLLPSCTVGTIEYRSIMEPIRSILRRKKAVVQFYEAEVEKIDHDNKTVHFADNSDIRGASFRTNVDYDYLVVGVGAEIATFGIPGVKEHACFLKEIHDAKKIRERIIDCIETAHFKDQSPEEKSRLLQTVVVGGGPTGMEVAGELQDLHDEDIKKWIPESDGKVILVEAMKNVLPMFPQALIDYTKQHFAEQKIDILLETAVKKVNATTVETEVTLPDGTKENRIIPYGLLVWAAGNAVRPVVKDLMAQIPGQKDRRGLEVTEYLVVKGTDNVYAIGDCAVAGYAPTAQVASQEGIFLGKLFNSMAKAEALENHAQYLATELQAAEDKAPLEKELIFTKKELARVKRIDPFIYHHSGALAYIGGDRAVADVKSWAGNYSAGGSLTYLFWRSAYLSMCFSGRNRLLVLMDWIKAKAFGRDVSRE